MKKSSLLSVAGILSMVLLSLTVQSCTIVGALIGLDEEKSRQNIPTGEFVAVEYLATLKPGPRVVLQLKDGRQIEGKYDGVKKDASGAETVYCIKLMKISGDGLIYPFDSIDSAYINKAPKKGSAVIGALVGAAIDVSIILIAKGKPSKPTPRPPGPGPFRE